MDGLSQRLSNMRQFVQQQINNLTAKQVGTLHLPIAVTCKHAHNRLLSKFPVCVAVCVCLGLGQLCLGRLAKLAGGTQDDTLAAQAALEKQLAAVGDDVEDINTRVGEVRLPLQAALHAPMMHSLFAQIQLWNRCQASVCSEVFWLWPPLIMHSVRLSGLPSHHYTTPSPGFQIYSLQLFRCTGQTMIPLVLCSALQCKGQCIVSGLLAAHAQLSSYASFNAVMAVHHACEFVQVHASVREMEGNLENMALSQQNANEGIFLLCK